MVRTCLLVLLVIGAIALAPRGALAAGPGDFDGDVRPQGGVALVTWGGGDITQVEGAADGRGCDLQSVWVYIGGGPLGYLPGAPAFVNAAFLDQHPGGAVAPGAILLVCRRDVPTGIQPVAFAPAFGGRVFDQPVELVQYPDGRFLIAQRGGDVLLAGAGPDVTFLDLPVRGGGSEEGLLSVALDPRFASNSHVWAYYMPDGGERRSRLSRFTVRGDLAEPSSELVVLEVPQPYANHNGGAIRFGPDGMLYLGFGDGGSGGDPHGNGQDLNTLLGKVIRIDVRNASSAQPYAIPADNPYASDGGRGEIWASGLRNPWRMAFDSATGALWLADVGQGAVEEIDVITRGGNYGWSVMEGDRCFRSGCSQAGLVMPVATYGHDAGCSVTGGVVSRGPALSGAYLFADHCSGRVWAMDAGSRGQPVEVGRVSGSPTSFGVDASGNVYIVQFDAPIVRVVNP